VRTGRSADALYSADPGSGGAGGAARAAHLRYGPGEAKPDGQANHRNGATPNTVLPGDGPVPLAIPRDRAGTILGMPQAMFSRAFKGSPRRRAKLRGLKRNAAVVLGDVGTSAGVDVPTRALEDPEPLVREHAAWALDRVRGGVPGVAPAAADADVPELGGGPTARHAYFGVELRAPDPRRGTSVRGRAACRIRIDR
jgi:hypothetical protein